MEPKGVIAQFLAEHFDDAHLAALRADTLAGRVPIADTSRCLVAHTGTAYLLNAESGERIAASIAYFELASDDQARQAALLPLIDAEMARRADEQIAVLNLVHGFATTVTNTMAEAHR